MKITVKPIDFFEAKKILLIPEIFIKVASYDEDDTEEMLNTDYIGGYVDGVLLSVAHYEPMGNGIFQYHPCVDPKASKEAKLKVTAAMLEYTAKNKTDIKILQARIPICYPETFLFAIKFGFRVVGAEDYRMMVAGFDMAYQRLILNYDLSEARNGQKSTKG